MCLCSAHLSALHLRQNKEVWRGWRFLGPVSSTKADSCSLAKPPLPYHSPFNSSFFPRPERRGLTTRTGRSGVGLLPVVRPDVAGARVSAECQVVCGEGGPLEGRWTTLLTVSLSQEKVERRSLVPVVLSDQIELPQSLGQLSVSFSKCQPAAIFNKLCLSSCQRGENTSYVCNGQKRTIKKNCSICSDPPGLWKPNKSFLLSC